MISAMKIRLPRTLNPCSNPTPTNPLRPLSIVGILKRSAQGYMFFCFLIYSELKNKMIETLKCESGDMEAAQWIPCPGEKDASWFPSGVLFVLSITVIIIFTAGLLVIASILLFLRQNRLSTPGTKALIGFLYLPYRPQMFWWEIPSFVRRLIILCMINFLPLHSVSYGLCIGAFFIILMILQQWLKPFHGSLANWMEIFSIASLLLFFISNEYLVASTSSILLNPEDEQQFASLQRFIVDYDSFVSAAFVLALLLPLWAHLR